MTHYPLLFGRREKVEGNGFIARVAVAGRVLLTDEDGEFWVEGINPETRLSVEVTLFSQPAATNNDLGEMALAA
jgi:hypothetical protein